MQETKIPCPVCQSDIFFTVELLLQGKSFSCSNETCNSVISLNNESSKEVINAYQKMQDIKDKPQS